MHLQLNLLVMHAVRRLIEASYVVPRSVLDYCASYPSPASPAVFKNMTGDEPAKLAHAIAKAIENMMMMIRAQTSDLDMSGPDRSFTSFRPLYLSSTSLLPPLRLVTRLLPV